MTSLDSNSKNKLVTGMDIITRYIFQLNPTEYIANTVQLNLIQSAALELPVQTDKLRDTYNFRTQFFGLKAR
uniref:Uncharacterized protein n=1 Tax=Timema bartmani TaxID=61472 RepID=A0A7R9F501_9NEOP|nr:unnamed protein product [Timema bartmani]